MRSPVRDILGPNGPIARAMADLGVALGDAESAPYEPRPQQLTMADEIAVALAAKETLLAEAGTGVGKSFAYLVPAMLRCMTLGEKVVIATNTIALQEQLVQRDIPFLMETLANNGWGIDEKTSTPVVPALCKGRGNYLSIRRLKYTSERQERLLPDGAARRSLHVIEDWAYTTPDGTVATLPALERMSVWDRVQSDSDNCMGRKCPTFSECFFQKSRRAMEAANLLVCNHALFFADLSLRRHGAGFLPAYNHVILDEAHAAEEVACDHFGLSLSEGRIERYLGQLYHANTGRGYLPQLAQILDAKGQGDQVDGAVRAVLEAQGVSRSFFEELLALFRSGTLKSGRLTGPGMIDSPLGATMRALAARLKALKERAPGEQDAFELNAYATRAEAIAFDADALISQGAPGSAYWIEAAGAGGDERASENGGSRHTIDARRPASAAGAAPSIATTFGTQTRFGGGAGIRVKLCCAPIEVGPILREHLFDKDIGIVLTSATLATGKLTARSGVRGPAVEVAGSDSAPAVNPAFAHVTNRLGCTGARALQLDSPFDFATQARLIVDLTVEPPRRSGAPPERAAVQVQHRRLAARVLHHVLATDGGAFVLFTSFETLGRVAAEIERPLRDAGIELFAQGRDGTPSQVLQRFRDNERSALLGAASFWQGVDVKGRGLRNVIITKLPFDPPDRPLVEARCERITARGGDPFREDSLPRAVLRFKQGFGRLIRSARDTGRVVVLDPRLVTARYGRAFLDALPPRLPIETIKGDDGFEEAE
ncbi:helicase C-terminal domain-containing protein [soil metagenome]